MSAQKIQLVLQGGGARMFALIAALEEVDVAVKNGWIEVTRIAGTSAGAIAGGLYAAGVSPAVMRVEFANFNRSLVIDWPTGEVRRLLKLLWRMLRGKPLAADRPLRMMLARLLKNAGHSDPRLEDLSTPVLIMAADVSNREPIPYDSQGDRKTAKLISCMLDSSAIPFFFRTASNSEGDLILDGGLVENLPAERLASPGIEGEANHEPHPILALSFEETRGVTPGTAVELAKSLLDTMIAASVKRIKKLKNVVSVNLDPAGVGLLDFERAQRILAFRDPEDRLIYDAARRKTSDALEDIRRLTENDRYVQLLSKTRWDGIDLKTGSELIDVYKRQHETRKFKQYRRRLTIVANSLLQEGELDYGSRDVVILEYELAPTTTPIDCLMARIAVNEGEGPSNVFFDVRDDEQREVPFVPIPVMAESSEGERVYAIQISFTPPLEPPATGEAPRRYSVRTEFRIAQAFAELFDDRQSHLASKISRADDSVDRIELELHKPSSFDRLTCQTNEKSIPLKREAGTVRRGQFDAMVWAAEDVADGSLARVDLMLT